MIRLPKRRPDLNPLDFTMWKQITSTMRKEEEKWPRDKKVSVAAFEARLEQTARGISARAINSALGSMKRRCASVIANDGSWVKGD